MEFLAKLRDAELQISRVAQSVELHVERSDASLLADEAGGASRSEVLALAESVERAQNQLQTATRQLVALVRRSVEGQAEVGDDDDTETEDEFEVKEEPQVSVKLEPGADPEEKCKMIPEIAASTLAVEKMESVDEAAPMTESGAAEVVESSVAASMRARAARLSIICGEECHRPDGREEAVGCRDELLSHYAFIVYAGFAENIMNKAKGTSIDADRVISSMTDKHIEDWRKMVHKHMLKVNRDFIKFLAKGNSSARSAKLFAGATSLAVSLLIRDKDQQFYLLKQVVEDLSHILDIARESLLAAELSPIEKSRDVLYTYSYSTFQGSLEDMSTYVMLIEQHDKIDTNRLPSFLVSLLRKFIWDCVDYTLQQQVVGAPPRMESQWKIFTEIGLTLTRLMSKLSTTPVTYKITNPSMNSTRLKAFNGRFPGRIPEALFANWCCLVSHSIEEPISNWNNRPLLTARRSIHGRQTAKRRISASSDINPRESKRLTTDKGSVSNLKTDAPKRTPLEQFLTTAKDTKHGLESAMRGQDASSISSKSTVPDTWTKAVIRLH